MSFSSAMRAISRRTGSKPEMMTASGVSSMMRSTPVSGFQGADVAALAADDAALHLVVGQGHHGHGALRHMVGGTALDGQRDLLPGVGLSLFLVVSLDLLEPDGLLVGHLVGQLLDEVGLRLPQRSGR